MIFFTEESNISYLVSWHLHTWVQFFARHEMRNNNYINAVSKKKKNLEAVKLRHLLLIFTQIYSFY